MSKRVIAVDFDGTLALYEGYRGPAELGEAVPNMLARVKRWLEEGHTVVIFTSRVSKEHSYSDLLQTQSAFLSWFMKYDLPCLDVTADKSPRFTEFWDDRAVAVRKNTGEGYRPPPSGFNYMLAKQDEEGNFSTIPLIASKL